MRINLIGNFKPNTGLTQDAMILRGLLTNQFGEPEIRNIHHVVPQCQEADINIFVESINPALFIFGGKNIWIPNPEWTYKTWVPYTTMVDEIWVKTKEAEKIFLQYTSNVKYIGWTSIDKVFSDVKNYNKAIVLVGKNPYRTPKPILRAYYQAFKENPELYRDLPELHIPYREIQFYFPDELKDKVILHPELKESDYDALLQECGLAICVSACEGFGHAVNEAMSSGCNLMLSPIDAFNELTEGSQSVLWGVKNQIIDHPETMCKIVDTFSNSLYENLITYTETPTDAKRVISDKMRAIYEKRHAEFIKLRFPETTYSLDNTLPLESDLPYVSIVTLTYNRKEFIPLAKYSYLIQSYPEDKLEWVIVDDGESIEEELLGISNVKYVKLDSKTDIGEKRNIGVKNALYDVIVMMDDDDVYPNNSVLQRVALLKKEPAKECVFCTTIPCYDIQKKTSFMNVPPMTLNMSERVSEATLCFTRKFWEDRQFTGNMAEGDTFIRGREQVCRELSPQEVIVSLVHDKNASSRKAPEGEPNGCHYGFSDELFLVVSSICP